MHIRSAEFIKGVVGEDRVLTENKPQVAFIGRSNAGKSSVINSLTGKKDLARTSSMPGRTQQINIFLINGAVYLIDLPGYGFAHGSHAERRELHRLVDWYLFGSPYVQKKVVLIIDANVGVTEADMDMLVALEDQGKDVVIVANKVDKISPSERKRRLEKIQDRVGEHTVILYSSPQKIGANLLAAEVLR